MKQIYHGLILESIKALEIKTSMVFDFANTATLSYLFYFFLIIDLYLWIPEDITQIFNAAAELAIPGIF